MATIANTDLGTSDPVDICKGFALFPSGAARAGIQVQGDTRTLFHTAPQIVVWKFNALATYGLFFGVCGPAYGVKFDAEGETDGDSLTLTVANDVMGAGFIFGLNLTLGFQVSVTQWTLHWVWDGWHSHIRSSWENIANLNVGINFDLISLLLDVLTRVLESEGKKDTFLQKSTTYLPNIIGSYGFYDQQDGQFAGNNGAFKAEPVIALPINLVPFIPPLAAIDEGLHALWGGVAAGPQLGLAFPTTVTMQSIGIDNQTYTNLTYEGDTVTGTGGTATANPQNISVALQQKVGISFTVGYFAQVWILKLFQIACSHNWDVLKAFGIDPTVTTRVNSVSNSIGNTSIASDTFSSLDPASIVEVILEPEGALA